MDDLFHAGEGGEAGAVHPAVVAHDGDGTPLLPEDELGLIAEGFDEADDAGPVRVRGVALENDEQRYSLPAATGFSASRTPTMVETPSSCMVTP